MIVTCGPGTGKSTLVKYINIAHYNSEIICMGTIGTATFVIGGTICH